MSDDVEGARFERHFMSEGASLPDFKLAPDGQYNLNTVEQTWQGWKARADADKSDHIRQWLRGQANAENDPKAKASFVEAHNAALAIIEGRA